MSLVTVLLFGFPYGTSTCVAFACSTEAKNNQMKFFSSINLLSIIMYSLYLRKFFVSIIEYLGCKEESCIPFVSQLPVERGNVANR